MLANDSIPLLGSRVEPASNPRPSETRNTRGLVAGLLLTLVTLVGCGETQVPVFPVSGKVTYQGKPAAGATVVLHPTNASEAHDGVVPSGVVQSDGRFAITVYEPGDGAPQGDYVATVVWRKMVSNGGSAAAGPNVLPKVYASPATSPVKVSVANGPTEVPPIVIK